MLNFNNKVLRYNQKWFDKARTPFRGEIVWTFVNETGYTSQAWLTNVKDRDGNLVKLKSFTLNGVEMPSSIREGVNAGTGSGYFDIPDGATLKFSIVCNTEMFPAINYKPTLYVRTSDGSTWLDKSKYLFKVMYNDMYLRYDYEYDIPRYDVSSSIDTFNFKLFGKSPTYDSFRITITNEAGADPTTPFNISMYKDWMYKPNPQSTSSVALRPNTIPVISGTRYLNGVAIPMTDEELFPIRYPVIGDYTNTVLFENFDSIELIVDNEYFPSLRNYYCDHEVKRTINIYGTINGVESLINSWTSSGSSYWILPGLGHIDVEQRYNDL